VYDLLVEQNHETCGPLTVSARKGAHHRPSLSNNDAKYMFNFYIRHILYEGSPCASLRSPLVSMALALLAYYRLRLPLLVSGPT
jgi:hypothetical protein